MTNLRNFDGQLKKVVAPLLEELGFARAGRARLWVRESATAKGVCQLCWFQVGESASSLDGQFTAEVGVYYPKYDRFCNGSALLGPVIGACHFDMRRRVGLFLTKPVDKWWPYTGAEEAVALQVAAVVRLVTKRGMPWLAQVDTPENAAIYNTGKLPEPDRLRREAFERHQARKS